MIKKQVTYEISDEGIMKVVIDNPETKNGLNWVGQEQMAECFQEMIENSSVKLAILAGNDDYFWTGGRVDPNNPGEQEKYARGIAKNIELRSKIKIPRIAAITGHCLKGGIGLVAECDFAIARKGVEFGFPEVPMGGVPMVVMAQTMDFFPKKKAIEYYLSGWNFTAEEALSFGLINAVVPKEEFWDVVYKYARLFLDTPKILVDLTLKAYNKLSEIHDPAEREAFSSVMLKEEILPAMTKVEQKYNP